MPLDVLAQVGQRVDLGQCLLHVVLAEGALAGRMGLSHRVGAEGLGHREQRDALHGARCLCARIVDAVQDLL